MSKLKTLASLVKDNPKEIKSALARHFARSKISHLVPDKIYLKMMYRAYIGKKLNLKSPQTFNEKLQWLKLYNRNPEYIKMVDKIEAKKYVADIIGKEYIIPTLGVWDRAEDINFDMLPDQFVLKCNHDSGSVIICKDKSSFNKPEAIKKLNNCLKNNLFYFGREWPYKNVKPKIFAETYLTDDKQICDYKFFCFNGDVKCFKIDFDRFIKHKANYYSLDRELLRFGETVCPPDFNRYLEMPIQLDDMIEKAKALSDGIPFVRVDFYELKGKVYFGELTFFPAGGFGPFEPEEWDEKLGSLIKPKNRILRRCAYNKTWGNNR